MVKQRNLNFRQSNSERAAGNSYGNFKKGLVKKFKNIVILNKYGKS